MRFAFLVAVAAITGCGVSPEYIDDPEYAETPAPPPAPKTNKVDAADKEEGPPRVDASPCGMSTRATRTYARARRYGSVEDFNSRNCPPSSKPAR